MAASIVYLLFVVYCLRLRWPVAEGCRSRVPLHSAAAVSLCDPRAPLPAGSQSCAYRAQQQESSQYVIHLERDFSNVKSDPALAEHVKDILERLKTFKVLVHPRIRLFYELLKKGMSRFRQRTADSLYTIDKYNRRQ